MSLLRGRRYDRQKKAKNDGGIGTPKLSVGQIDLRLTADKLAAEGIEAEVIDLRWLDRASIDWTTIEESIKKTNNVLLVEQGVRGTSYGGWLADEIQRRYFDWLDQPVQRVTGAEASPSISKVLERAATARTEEVVDGLKLVMQAKGDA